MRFAFPMPPNLANSRMHWAVKNKARREYFELLDQLQAANYLPAPPRRPLAKPRLTSCMTLVRRMDADNAVARHKWPLDWLQSRGYVLNDRDIEWLAMPEQRTSGGTAASMIHIDLTGE